MDTIIKWKNSAEKWELFDNSEINATSRDHAISLFSGGIPVIASEDGTFITNSATLADQYRKQNKKVILFKDLQPSDKKFQDVGFCGFI